MSTKKDDDVWVMHERSGQPNRKFKDEYEMKEELGKGGFGVVRRCVLKADKREFAVKHNNTPDKKDSMVKESDFCTSPSTQFCTILYEIASGGDVMDQLIIKEYFPPAEASVVIRQVLRGVQHMHDRGLLHRDLKPQNLLLKSKRSTLVKIADFGLTIQRRMDASTGQYMRHRHLKVGTPAYFSPEVSKDEAYDVDCDIWSCGVILYQLIAGYQPFWDENAATVQTKIQQIQFDYPNPEWHGLDQARDMISQMLCDISQRPTSTAGLLNHAFIQSYPDPEPPPKPIDAYERFKANRKIKSDLLTSAHQHPEPTHAGPSKLQKTSSQ